MSEHQLDKSNNFSNNFHNFVCKSRKEKDSSIFLVDQRVKFTLHCSLVFVFFFTVNLVVPPVHAASLLSQMLCRGMVILVMELLSPSVPTQDHIQACVQLYKQ